MVVPRASAKAVRILDKLQGFYKIDFEKMLMLWDKEGRDAFQILVGTVLSQRTRDEMTERATKALFAKYPGSRELARAEAKDVERLVRPSNFYKTKAKRVIGVARVIVEKFGGQVPKTMEELLEIPGVGRKTAGCVVVYGFRGAALPVDTHVNRIANRLGLVETKKPEDTEKALKRIVPKKDWIRVNDLLVRHGQAICRPIGPKCPECPVKAECKYYKESFSKNDI